MEETKRRRFIIRAVLEGEVDVHEEPVPPLPPGVLYQLSAPVVLDGTNFIDTSIQLMTQDRDFSIAYEFINGVLPGDSLLIDCSDQYGNQTGLKVRVVNSYLMQLQGKNANLNMDKNEDSHYKAVLYHQAGSFTYKNRKRKSTESQGWTATIGSTADPFASSDKNLTIGAASYNEAHDQKWKGTVVQFIVYDHVLTNEEIEEFIAF